MSRRSAPLARGTLLFLLAVILWGSFVRASGSGAGCGAHWPLCNGQVIPETGNWHMLVEFTHRVSSGISLILCGAICYFSFREYERGSLMRKAGLATLLFILTEALVGAGLVLLRLVAHNDSSLRAVSMAVHFLNTYFLLASVTLVAAWSGLKAPGWLRPSRKELWLGLGAVLGLSVLGASGAVTALGDTLFPARTLVQGFAQDFSVSHHFLVSLRIYHPLVALLVSLYAILFARVAIRRSNGRAAEGKVFFHAILCVALQCAQLLLGFLNFMLLAPIWLQLSHLLFSDLIWINMILLLSNLWFGEALAFDGAHGTAATARSGVSVAPSQLA